MASLKSSPIRKSPSAAGFTLVELMVVVMILAIAAAIVIPNFTGSADFQAMSAARMVVADLQYAQDAAVTGQTSITVDFDTDAHSYTLSNASGPLVHPMTKADYTMSFPAMRGFESVRLAAVFGTVDHSVTFDVTGSPDQGGTITVLAGSYQYTLDVAEGTGLVSVSE